METNNYIEYYYNFKLPNLSYFNGFEFKLMNKKVENNTKQMVNYIDSNKDKNIIILSANAYFFKTSFVNMKFKFLRIIIFSY